MHNFLASTGITNTDLGQLTYCAVPECTISYDLADLLRRGTGDWPMETAPTLQEKLSIAAILHITKIQDFLFLRDKHMLNHTEF